MTAERKRKPKFRVGQVVVVRGGFMHAGMIAKIARKPKCNKEGDWEYVLSLGDIECVEWALRRLTKRESGR